MYSHYTSIDSMLSIIESGELWFGNAEYMNDKKDSRHFIDLLRESLSSDKEIPSEKLQSFFSRVEKTLENDMPYIFCLSANYDDAAQWERYADNANGCEIVFNDKFKSIIQRSSGMFEDVFYRFDIKKHKHYEIIKEYLLSGDLGGFSDEKGLISNIVACSYIRKHRGFSSEKEVRITNLNSMLIEDAYISTKKLNGVVSRKMIVPIRGLSEKHNERFSDLIDEIIIGPRSIQTANDLIMYFKEIGLRDFSMKVRKSDCPLR